MKNYKEELIDGVNNKEENANYENNEKEMCD